MASISKQTKSYVRREFFSWIFPYKYTVLKNEGLNQPLYFRNILFIQESNWCYSIIDKWSCSLTGKRVHMCSQKSLSILLPQMLLIWVQHRSCHNTSSPRKKRNTYFLFYYSLHPSLSILLWLARGWEFNFYFI